MKAKNFRIGNIVKYDNRIFAIHTIADEFPTLDTIEFGIGVVDWNNIKPIELTDEWLLELGFKIYEDNLLVNIIGRLGFMISKQDNDYFLLYRSDIGMDYCIIKPIEFVHDLQNTVFAISDKELDSSH